MHDEIMSTIKTYPTSHLVYSSLSAFADLNAGELPGTWFVAALGPLGHSPEAIRQTLFRLTRSQALIARQEGRSKYYRCTPSSRVEINVGLDKIFLDPVRPWDGNWTLVHYAFADAERVERDRLRNVLKIMGFAPLGIGLFIHPADQKEPLEQSIQDLHVGSHVHIFRSKRQHAGDDPAFIKSLWDLEGLSDRYQEFTERFESLARSKDKIMDEMYFAMRFVVVIEFLRIAWDDPCLPPELLPREWQGDRARLLARKLYRLCLPRARDHAASFLS
jgi:phenylacetic acid degradation operon negative regulatory protein